MGSSPRMGRGTRTKPLLAHATRNVAWESVMRVRASQGVRITNFYGSLNIRGNDLLALPNCDEDAVFGVEFAFEADMLTTSSVIVQAALLHTSSTGERRIRVLTTAVPVTTASSDVLFHANQDVIINLIAKSAAAQVPTVGLAHSRNRIQNKCVSLIRAAKKSSSGALLPPNLELIPLYTMAL
jgi:protein transport protein SEC24